MKDEASRPSIQLSRTKTETVPERQLQSMNLSKHVDKWSMTLSGTVAGMEVNVVQTLCNWSISHEATSDYSTNLSMFGVIRDNGVEHATRFCIPKVDGWISFDESVLQRYASAAEIYAAPKSRISKNVQSVPRIRHTCISYQQIYHRFTGYWINVWDDPQWRIFQIGGSTTNQK